MEVGNIAWVIIEASIYIKGDKPRSGSKIDNIDIISSVIGIYDLISIFCWWLFVDLTKQEKYEKNKKRLYQLSYLTFPL